MTAILWIKSLIIFLSFVEMVVSRIFLETTPTIGSMRIASPWRKKQLKNKTKTTWKNPKSGNKLSYNEQKEFKRLEKEIENLEGEKINLETQFTDPNLSSERITELSIELSQLDKTIEVKTVRWFELSSKVD